MNLEFHEIPEQLRQQLIAQYGDKTKNGKQRQAAWKDVPDSWGICKPHGWVWFPKDAGCVFCEYGDEGIFNVQGDASEHEG